LLYGHIEIQQERIGLNERTGCRSVINDNFNFFRHRNFSIDGKVRQRPQRCEWTCSTLAGFRIEPGTGKLAPIGSLPTEQQPRSFAIDPSGHFLAAVGELSDSMTVYTIDQASGALSKLASYPVGSKPNWVEFVDLP
jgi:hypothetical protein